MHNIQNHSLFLVPSFHWKNKIGKIKPHLLYITITGVNYYLEYSNDIRLNGLCDIEIRVKLIYYLNEYLKNSLAIGNLTNGGGSF